MMILWLGLAGGTIRGAGRGEIVAARAYPAGRDGSFRRVAIYHSAGRKYPFERREETVVSGPALREQRVATQRRMVGDHILVVLRDGADAADLAALCERLGTRIRRRLRSPRHFLVETPHRGVDAVPDLVAACRAANDLVEVAEPDALIELDDTDPNDPYFANGSLWGMQQIDCPAAWDFNTGSGTVVVAVIDTGIDWTHPDLAANAWINPGESGTDSNGYDRATNNVDDDANGFVDDVRGWNFYGNNKTPMDYHGHGTRCSGHIGAVGNNGAGVVGVAWSVKLMPLCFTSADASQAPLSDAVDCLYYASMMRTNGHNVRVINASWGDAEFSQGLYNAVSNSGAAGILCAASAGNTNEDIDDHPHYPASFDLDSVVAVAATDESDGRWSSSSYGPLSVDLGAPGVNIWSTKRTGGYESRTGTSRAAPHVAGVAALVWDTMPSLTHQQVKQAILAGTDPVPSLAGITVTGGRLNAHGALLEIPPAMAHSPLQNTTNAVSPYAVDAEIRPAVLLRTDRLALCWNTDGATNRFTTNVLSRVSNELYRAWIPAQPLGTGLHYFVEAVTTNDLSTRSPADAPSALYGFEIVGPLPLVVTGMPLQAGQATPGYGSTLFASGIVVSASAGPFSDPTNGSRYAVSGWTGAGSTPASGESNQVSFRIRQASTCAWHWATEYSLRQTSSVPGIIDATSWWRSGTDGATVAADALVTVGSNDLAFAEWHVDGSRWPDPTNQAENPAVAVTMHTGRVATAVYIAEGSDTNTNGVGDWWERFYFGDGWMNVSNDADGDGMGDGGEYTAGTDPRDADDVLGIAAVTYEPAHTTVVLSWPAVDGRTYTIRARSNLLAGTWSDLTSGIAAAGTINAVTIRVDQATRRFYRLEASYE